MSHELFSLHVHFCLGSLTDRKKSDCLVWHVCLLSPLVDVAQQRLSGAAACLSFSHAQVLTVMVEGSSKITHARTHGCLHLVDLAGSERVGKSGAEGQQLLEAQNINRSLR